MTTVGTKNTYEYIQDFPKLPAGEEFGVVSSVATDSQDNLYVFQRKDPVMMVFDRDGNFLKSWGNGAVESPHGLTITNDLIYITDREGSVAVTFDLDGRPVQILGQRGFYSDTGCDTPGELVPRVAGPFNFPTEMAPGPSGDIYVSDGYRNSRIHRFSADGQLKNSWGTPGNTEPGQFQLPHSIMVDADEKVYVCDRANKRIQIFTAEGEFINMWTGMGGPNNMVQDKNGLFYIAEQAYDNNPDCLTIRDGDGEIVDRRPVRHAHGLWVDSRCDIYLGLTTFHSVDKYVLK